MNSSGDDSLLRVVRPSRRHRLLTVGVPLLVAAVLLVGWHLLPRSTSSTPSRGAQVGNVDPVAPSTRPSTSASRVVRTIRVRVAPQTQASLPPQASWPPLPAVAPTEVLPKAKDPLVAELTAWDREELGECVLMVKGLSPDAAVRRMGGDPAKHVPQDPDELSGDWTITGVGSIGGVTVLVEDNGYSCSDRDRLHHLTADGVVAASAYWSSDADTTLSYARDGTILTTWDPIVDERDGTEPKRLDALLRQVGPDAANGHAYAAMVAVATRLMGPKVTDDWKPAYWVKLSE